MQKAKIILCKLLFLLLLSNRIMAQDENYSPPQGLNNWYVEIGGPAIFYSVNYEKYLFRTYSEKLTWTARVGAGYTPFNFDILNTEYLAKNTFVFPFSTTFLKGDGKEKLEFGGGFSLLSEGFATNEIIPHAIVGLRVMESNDVCFRLNYVPYWRGGNVMHWVGISIGKNFSFK